MKNGGFNWIWWRKIGVNACFQPLESQRWQLILLWLILTAYSQVGRITIEAIRLQVEENSVENIKLRHSLECLFHVLIWGALKQTHQPTHFWFSFLFCGVEASLKCKSQYFSWFIHQCTLLHCHRCTKTVVFPADTVMTLAFLSSIYSVLSSCPQRGILIAVV